MMGKLRYNLVMFSPFIKGGKERCRSEVFFPFGREFNCGVEIYLVKSLLELLKFMFNNNLPRHHIYI
jgi:hypothetical protein